MSRVRCHICDREYASKDSLRKHIKSQHPRGKEPAAANTVDTLRIYPSTSEGEDARVNGLLDKYKDKFDEDEWKRMKRKANPSEEEPHPKKLYFRCSECGEQLNNIEDLTEHREEEHPVCIVCRERFPDKISYKRHKHPTCQICNKRVVALNEHLKSHPKCHRCGEFFKTETRLKRHIDKEHRVRPKVNKDLDIPSSQMDKCPICYKRIERRFLERHIRENHPRDRSRSPMEMESDIENASVLDLSASEDDNRSLNDRVPPQMDDQDSDYQSAPSQVGSEDQSMIDDEEDADETAQSDDDSMSDALSDVRSTISSDGGERRKRARSEEISDDASSVKTVKSVSDVSTLSAGRSIVPVDYSFSEGDIECPKCNLKFPTRALLSKHMKEHKKKKITK